MEPTEITIEKNKKIFRDILRKKVALLKRIFKSATFKHIAISLTSSVVTLAVVFFVILYNKNTILDKVFQLRNEQISAMINGEIARDTTLLEAEKLLANNAQEALLNQERSKQEALEKSKEVSPKSIVDIVRAANPAVVSIALYKNVAKTSLTLNATTGQIEQKQNGTERKNVGSGSGFLVSADGMIVTNRHVVDAKDVEYEITLNSGVTEIATVLAIDPVYDVAIMKINGGSKKYAYLELGDSDELKVGESVLAIGNALGEFKNSVSVGIVSGLSRSVTASNKSGVTERLDKVIQTDAAINPGNSGRPLINLYGKVVGVNVAIAEKSQSVGFALPINSIKGVINSVKKTGKIVRPYVGIRYTPINEAVKVAKNLSVDFGILVVKNPASSDPAVIVGSPAERAGILEGDVITEVNGKKITKDSDFSLLIRDKKVGDTVSMKILRNGKETTAYVVLAEAK